MQQWAHNGHNNRCTIGTRQPCDGYKSAMQQAYQWMCGGYNDRCAVGAIRDAQWARDGHIMGTRMDAQQMRGQMCDGCKDGCAMGAVIDVQRVQ